MYYISISGVSGKSFYAVIRRNLFMVHHRFTPLATGSPRRSAAAATGAELKTETRGRAGAGRITRENGG
jgi:hypothetical protein